MTRVLEVHRQAAVLVMDVTDTYAAVRGFRGEHPGCIEPLRFQLVARMLAGPPETRQPISPIELQVVRNASGFHVFFGVTLLASGERRNDLAAAGEYVLRVSGPAYQSLEQRIKLPAPAKPVLIKLEPSAYYPFPDAVSFRPPAEGSFDCTAERTPGDHGPTLLRGSVLQANGRGIAGAKVVVTDKSNTYTTVGDGQWLLWFDPPSPTDKVTVRLDSPSVNDQGVVQLDAAGNEIRELSDIPDVCLVRGCENSLRQTALRGRVLTGGGGVEGAVIGVAGLNPTSRTAGDGSFSYYFPPDQLAGPVTVTATLPSGAVRNQPNIQVVPRATVDVPTFQFP